MRLVSILFYLMYFLLYCDYTNTHFSARFLASLTPGVRSSVNIFYKGLIEKKKINPTNGGRQGFQSMVSMRHAIILILVI